MRDLVAGYGKSEVLLGVTMEIRRGEIVTMVGRQRRRQIHDLAQHLRADRHPFGPGQFKGQDIAGYSTAPAGGPRPGLRAAGAQRLPFADRLENLEMGGLHLEPEKLHGERHPKPSSPISRACESAATRRRARFRAGSARCWPSAAA